MARSCVASRLRLRSVIGRHVWSPARHGLQDGFTRGPVETTIDETNCAIGSETSPDERFVSNRPHRRDAPTLLPIAGSRESGFGRKMGN